MSVPLLTFFGRYSDESIAAVACDALLSRAFSDIPEPAVDADQAMVTCLLPKWGSSKQGDRIVVGRSDGTVDIYDDKCGRLGVLHPARSKQC
jgi:hypothetical protein